MSTNDELTLSLESNDFDCERLRVRTFHGKDAISQLFTYELQLVCLDHDGPAPGDMVGAKVTLVIDRAPPDGRDGDLRWSGTQRLHGVIAAVKDALSTHADVRVYTVTVVPRAFLLTLVETQDIFVATSIPDIVAAKLAAVQLDDSTEARLGGKYAAREFVAQFHETDMQFVSRLTEHLGISFFFTQGDDSESLVFTDNASGFGWLESPIPFGGHGEKLGVYALESEQRMIPAYFAVRDYNYRAPLLDLTGEQQVDAGFAGGVIEFGTHQKTPDEGAALARVRSEERLATQLVYRGKSGVPSLSAGSRFTLTDHPDLGTIDLLVTSVEHTATAIVTGFESGPTPGYENVFTAIPADRTYRPPRVTPKPRIAGLVTGVIDPGAADPATQYAQIDEQGRYLVRFLFDTTPPGERPASHRVRMAQNHSGENYGTHFPLKPGVEVAVGFINGDPDRPLIVGTVPNAMRPSPVNATNPGLHRIKTRGGVTIDMGE